MAVPASEKKVSAVSRGALSGHSGSSPNVVGSGASGATGRFATNLPTGFAGHTAATTGARASTNNLTTGSVAQPIANTGARAVVGSDAKAVVIVPAFPAKSQKNGAKGKGPLKKKRKRYRPLPPGPRLLRAIAAVGLLVAGQAFLVPLGDPCQGTTGVVHLEVPLAAPFTLTTPLPSLRQQLEVACNINKLTPGVFAVDPDSGSYVEFNGYRQFPAASMIKVPVLVALFNALDRGDIDSKTILTIKQEHVAGGSGHLQWRPVGTKLPLMDVAELMIVISDNTATNMLIDLLGGKEVVNKKYQQWGLKNTVINNPLADLAGTNKTSPYDLVYLLARVERGELMSEVWHKKMLEIMGRTKTRTLINPGLPPGAKLAHKTGDIGSMVGDTGIVTTPDGHRYILAMQVERPHNDRRANELCRKVSALVYDGIHRSQLSFAQQQAQTQKELEEGKTQAPKN
jgi:beta-lactamase class A